MSYLGIDLGTSAVKAVLVDEGQRVAAASSAALEAHSPRPGWSEQDPESWWRGTTAAIDEVRHLAPAVFTRLRGIGLSGQMHGATLLDAAGQVLRPSILWNDTRAFAECGRIEGGVPGARQITGNQVMPGFTAPKLLWVRSHEPALFERTAMVLLPKDYVRYRLCGDYVSDMSDASGTAWLDVGKRAWSPQMLAASFLTLGQVPRLVEGSEAGGEVSPGLARAWGIGHTVRIAGGAGDNAAAALGLGIAGPGRAMVSLGTSGVLFAGNDRFLPNAGEGVHAFCHAVPGRWHQMSVILSAASSLSWLAAATRLQASDLVRLAEQADVARAPIFLPYLNGERSPHNDPHARGVFFGLSTSDGPAALAYSVMEGVAFAIADGYAALRRAGTELHEASFVGGGSQSAYWARICATATGLSMLAHGGGHVGGALGAARLARLACTGESVGDVCTPAPVASSSEPDPAWAGVVADRLGQYRRLYRALRDEFPAFACRAAAAPHGC